MRYELERGKDGNYFQCIATIGAKVSYEKYNYLDKAASIGISYYRLFIIEENPSVIAYSRMASVIAVCEGGNAITVYPTLTHGMIMISGAPRGAKIMVYDVTGRTILKEQSASQDIEIVNLGSMASDTYYIIINDGKD